jgi:rRNA large subunit m3Psi methyltransferase RlmH
MGRSLIIGTAIKRLSPYCKVTITELAEEPIKQRMHKPQPNPYDMGCGGVLGLAASVIDQSHWQVSLSSLTFPHPMVRLVWVEQIYRAFRIPNNEPYHK